MCFACFESKHVFWLFISPVWRKTASLLKTKKKYSSTNEHRKRRRESKKECQKWPEGENNLAPIWGPWTHGWAPRFPKQPEPGVTERNMSVKLEENLFKTEILLHFCSWLEASPSHIQHTSSYFFHSYFYQSHLKGPMTSVTRSDRSALATNWLGDFLCGKGQRNATFPSVPFSQQFLFCRSCLQQPRLSSKEGANWST